MLMRTVKRQSEPARFVFLIKQMLINLMKSKGCAEILEIGLVGNSACTLIRCYEA